MAVLETFRVPSLCRHVHRALWRSVVLDLPPIISATACHQSNDVERYSRYNVVAHIDPKCTGNAGAIDEMPHDSDQSWQAKAADAL